MASCPQKTIPVLYQEILQSGVPHHKDLGVSSVQIPRLRVLKSLDLLKQAILATALDDEMWKTMKEDLIELTTVRNS